MGRNNNRALDGPCHLPSGTQMVAKVNETYQALFKVWADTYVPKLIYAPKWHKDDSNLKPGDLVYMKKSPDNKLESKWVIGIVEQAVPGRDGKVRRVIVKYHNASEAGPQLTDRAVRTLVKIFDIEEYILQEDLAELLRRLDKEQVNCSGSGVFDYFDYDPTDSRIWPQDPVPSQPGPCPSNVYVTADASEDFPPDGEQLDGDRCRIPSSLIVPCLSSSCGHVVCSMIDNSLSQVMIESYCLFFVESLSCCDVESQSIDGMMDLVYRL